MPKFKKLNLTRRWIKARPGSVLILVIALLVLLALIGTAYLSSTQTERYTSHQNTINTEADLLMDGMVNTVNGTVANGLLSTSGQFRAPAQDMPTVYATTPTNPIPNGYYNYDSAVTVPYVAPTDPDPADLFLGDRLPVGPAATPSWNNIAWPLFKDPAGDNTFDSPLVGARFFPQGLIVPTNEQPVHLGIGAHKGSIQFQPTWYKLNDGSIVPAMTLTGAGYLNIFDSTSFVSGSQIYAADADGDGVADSLFTKVPVGQIDGVSYYVATRIIDNNSAINTSSAWTQGPDAQLLGSPSPTINYGFFRSNIGLYELLNQTVGLPNTPDAEMNAVNSTRVGLAFSGSGSAVSTTPALTPLPNYSDPTILSGNPVGTTAPVNYNWFSYGDVLENLLTRRPGNAGVATLGGFTSQWLGLTQSAALASRFALTNPNLQQTIEKLLSNELLYGARSTAYSPAQATLWYNDLFSGLNTYNGINTTAPLRTILTCSNPESNAAPSRFGNASASQPTPWALFTNYSFGDWVTDSGRSYVCMSDHASNANNEPLDGKTNPGAVGIWADAQNVTPDVANLTPGMPWSTVPVKASINTAPFEQLWLNFCHVMTDSISPDPVATPKTPNRWQPPMQAAGAGVEPQLPMFRSTLRNVTNIPTKTLTSSQMMKLRAALAAVNTMDLRDGDDNVTSRRIVLTDDATGAPLYDVEVYGSEIQPFIGQEYAHVDATPANNFVAIQLLNPYDQNIVIPNAAGGNTWKFCTINRASFPNLSLTDLSVSGGPIVPPGPITIPARAAGGNQAGMIVIQSSLTGPAGYTAPTGVTVVVVPGLAASIGQELIILKPRLALGGTSQLTVPTNVPVGTPYYGDYYDEGTNLADLVPVDQVDTSNLIAQGDYYYRRGSDATSRAAWNFVYPGPYTPGGSPPQAFSASAPVSATNPNMSGYISGPADKTGTVPSQPTYTTVPLVINNTHMAGPNPLAAVGTPLYPFGGFARNGDMLQIPFIGSYRIRPYAPVAPYLLPTFTEMNSITMDSSLAGDSSAPQPLPATDTAATPIAEQLGRFCPVGDPGTGTFDFATGSTAFTSWHYHWATRLFDYFTVDAPSDDYYPNTDPAGATREFPVAAAKYPGVPPVPTANNQAAFANAVKANNSEDTTGIEGRININTAPLAVLAQLPFTGTDPAFPTTPTKVAQNAVIAGNIVTYRAANGPFKTILELYRVPGFKAENDSLINVASPAQAGAAQGIFSPNGFKASVTTGDGVTLDFKERFLLLNNISNLITTRSDTFTCYVLLQGWRNVGTTTPTLAVQRRAAFILDRNGVTPSNNKPFNFKIPTGGG